MKEHYDCFLVGNIWHENRHEKIGDDKKKLLNNNIADKIYLIQKTHSKYCHKFNIAVIH